MEGTLWDSENIVYEAKLNGGRLTVHQPYQWGFYSWRITDQKGGERKGEGEVEISVGGTYCRGVYRQEDDEVTIYYRLANPGNYGRADRFPPYIQTGYGHCLLILRRVRPRK